MALKKVPYYDEVKTWVQNTITSGDKISVTVDETAETITIDTTALDTEEVQDTVASLVASDSNLSWTYDDTNGTLTISLTNSISVDTLEADNINRTQVATRIYQSSAETINENTLTQIQFDTADFDDDNEFNSTNNAVVVNEEGTYRITVRCQFADDIKADSRIFLDIDVNGNTRSQSNRHTSISDFVGAQTATTEKLTQNDEITSNVLFDSGGSGGATLQSGVSKTYLIVEELG